MFVKTDQLDGETDWKTRTALKTTHKYRLKNGGVFDDGILISVEVPEASSQIYEFRGLARVVDQSRKGLKEVKEAARLENTIWMGMNIAHGEVWAMVIYCGSETKIQLNKKSPRTKWGKTDTEINTLSKVLFFVLLVISFALEGGNMWRNTWWLQIFRF
jgi:phospholipid-translocating ATPase